MFSWQFGGEQAFFSPLTGKEPEFNPQKWNHKKNIRKTHNCYAYMFDIINHNFERKPQPGYASGYPSISNGDIRSCDKLMERILADNPSVKQVNFDDKCPSGHRKAFLAVDDGDDPDYHFYRQDKNGYWSHKPGSTEATMLDSSKKNIRDPNDAKRTGSVHNYKKPCGYFCYDPTKTKISNKVVNK